MTILWTVHRCWCRGLLEVVGGCPRDRGGGSCNDSVWQREKTRTKNEHDVAKNIAARTGPNTSPQSPQQTTSPRPCLVLPSIIPDPSTSVRLDRTRIRETPILLLHCVISNQTIDRDSGPIEANGAHEAARPTVHAHISQSSPHDLKGSPISPQTGATMCLWDLMLNSGVGWRL